MELQALRHILTGHFLRQMTTAVGRSPTGRFFRRMMTAVDRSPTGHSLHRMMMVEDSGHSARINSSAGPLREDPHGVPA